jgi:predicted SnoaL-like aldol condensation-catalyzing enzyme
MATPGRQFFDEHMAYIYAGNLDGMIDDQYREDAILISPFDIMDTPPPHIVRGREALKAFFHKYIEWQGSINVESVYDFAETEDAITFQAVFTSHTGKWVVGDAWYIKEKKIAYHFSFAHKIEEST